MSQANIDLVQVLIYVAGVCCPFHSVNIVSGLNVRPTANITIPSYPQVLPGFFNDRVPVQIFIKHAFAGVNTYQLAFDGEVDGIGASSSASSQDLTLRCSSLLGFMEDVNILMITDTLGTMETDSTNIDQGSIVVNQALRFPASFFLKGFAGEEVISSPSEYLFNCINFISGKIPEHKSTTLWDWYTKHTKKIKLSDRTSTVPLIDGTDIFKGAAFPLIEGMQGKKALELLRNSSNVGSGGSFQQPLLEWMDMLTGSLGLELYTPSYATMSEDGKLQQVMVKPIMYESVPPACNIVYRSLLSNFNYYAQVRGMPTRVRTEDPDNVIQAITNSEGVIRNLLAINFYPNNNLIASTTKDDKYKNYYAQILTDYEKYTGTYLYNTQLPVWASYVKSKETSNAVEADKELEEYYNRLLKYLLTMRRYQGHTMSATGRFNLAYTPGFQGAVFDYEGSNNAYVGQVLTVTHTIDSLGNATSNLDFAMVRPFNLSKNIPSEEFISATESMGEVLSDPDSCNTIYNKIIGSRAVANLNKEAKATNQVGNPNSDPKVAYSKTRRRGCSLQQYLKFMGASTLESGYDAYGESIPLVLGGSFFTDRVPVKFGTAGSSSISLDLGASSREFIPTVAPSSSTVSTLIDNPFQVLDIPGSSLSNKHDNLYGVRRGIRQIWDIVKAQSVY